MGKQDPRIESLISLVHDLGQEADYDKLTLFEDAMWDLIRSVQNYQRAARAGLDFHRGLAFRSAKTALEKAEGKLSVMVGGEDDEA